MRVRARRPTWLLVFVVLSGCGPLIPACNLNLFPPCTINGVQVAWGSAAPGDPCATCSGANSSAYTPVADGGGCGGFLSGEVCVNGTCEPQSDCFVGGLAIRNGDGCGSDLVCSGGTCKAGCVIPSSTFLTPTEFHASGSANPSDICQMCDPAVSTTAWTPLAEGIVCGNTSACHHGQCLPGCHIDGAFAAPGPNPGNPCEVCEPDTSPGAWLVSADGASCSGCDVCQGDVCGPATLAIPASDPGALAAGGGQVFVADLATGSVWAGPESGSGAPYAITGFASPSGLIEVGGTLYLADTGNDRIAMAPAAGGAPITLVANVQSPAAVATDGTRLYWAAHGSPASDGGGVASIWLSDGGDLVAYSAGHAPRDLAVDDQGLYWIDDALNELWFAPPDGGVGRSVSTTKGTPQAIALDANWVYWTTLAGDVYAYYRSTQVVSYLAQGPADLSGLVTDGANLYFANHGSAGVPGSVVRVGADGSSPVTLFTGGNPVDVALDDQCLYVSLATDAGSVLRLDP